MFADFVTRWQRVVRCRRAYEKLDSVWDYENFHNYTWAQDFDIMKSQMHGAVSDTHKLDQHDEERLSNLEGGVLRAARQMRKLADKMEAEIRR